MSNDGGGHSPSGIKMILSPAKTLDLSPWPPALDNNNNAMDRSSLQAHTTMPDCCPTKTKQIAQAMKKLSEGQLAKQLGREAERLAQDQLTRLAEADSLARQIQQQSGANQQAQSDQQAMRLDLADELKDLGDEQLAQLAPQVLRRQSAPRGPVDQTPHGLKPDVAIQQARNRLKTLMDELLKQQLAMTDLDDQTPDKYRKTVDRYFQILSDDLE